MGKYDQFNQKPVPEKVLTALEEQPVRIAAEALCSSLHHRAVSERFPAPCTGHVSMAEAVVAALRDAEASGEWP